MYKFNLYQDGMLAASSEAESREKALQEILHYAGVYLQEGAVRIKEDFSLRPADKAWVKAGLPSRGDKTDD